MLKETIAHIELDFSSIIVLSVLYVVYPFLIFLIIKLQTRRLSPIVIGDYLMSLTVNLYMFTALPLFICASVLHLLFSSIGNVLLLISILFLGCMLPILIAVSAMNENLRRIPPKGVRINNYVWAGFKVIFVLCIFMYLLFYWVVIISIIVYGDLLNFIVLIVLPIIGFLIYSSIFLILKDVIMEVGDYYRHRVREFLERFGVLTTETLSTDKYLGFSISNAKQVVYYPTLYLDLPEEVIDGVINGENIVVVLPYLGKYVKERISEMKLQTAVDATRIIVDIIRKILKNIGIKTSNQYEFLFLALSRMLSMQK